MGSRYFFWSILGSHFGARDFRKRAQGGHFGPKAARARRFFFDFRDFFSSSFVCLFLVTFWTSKPSRKYSFYHAFSTSHAFCKLVENGPKMDPRGGPRGPTMTLRRALDRKRRQAHALAYFGRSRAAPAALIFTCSLILGGLFAISRGKQRLRPPPPEPRKRLRTHAKSCPEPPLGACADSGPTLGRFGADLGSIWGSIWGPFLTNLGCLLGPFWTPLKNFGQCWTHLKNLSYLFFPLCH